MLPLRAHTTLASRRGGKLISGDFFSSRKAPPAPSLEVKDPTPPGHNLQRGSSKRALSLEVLTAAQERGLGGRGEIGERQEGTWPAVGCGGRSR